MDGFFYSTEINLNVLNQGDLIQLTNDIKGLIESNEIKINPKAKYLIILTHTCDIVHDKSKYITFTPVIFLEDFIQELIEESMKKEIERKGQVLSIKKKLTICDKILRLANNNLSEYFFLIMNTGREINNHLVALLKESFSINSKSIDHSILKDKDAKVAELNENFRAKLGWLIGDMYARVATKDYIPEAISKEDFVKEVDQTLEKSVLWIEGKKIDSGERKLREDIDSLDQDNIREYLNNIHIPSNEEKIKNLILEKLSTTSLSTDEVIKITEIIVKSTTLQSVIR